MAISPETEETHAPRHAGLAAKPADIPVEQPTNCSWPGWRCWTEEGKVEFGDGWGKPGRRERIIPLICPSARSVREPPYGCEYACEGPRLGPTARGDRGPAGRERAGGEGW